MSHFRIALDNIKYSSCKNINLDVCCYFTECLACQHISMHMKGSYLHGVHQVVSTTQSRGNSSKIIFLPLTIKDFHLDKKKKNKRQKKPQKTPHTHAKKKKKTKQQQNKQYKNTKFLFSPQDLHIKSAAAHINNLLSSLGLTRNAKICKSGSPVPRRWIKLISTHWELPGSNIRVKTFPKHMEKSVPLPRRQTRRMSLSSIYWAVKTAHLEHIQLPLQQKCQSKYELKPLFVLKLI